jgi:hypothetical protein
MLLRLLNGSNGGAQNGNVQVDVTGTGGNPGGQINLEALLKNFNGAGGGANNNNNNDDALLKTLRAALAEAFGGGKVQIQTSLTLDEIKLILSNAGIDPVQIPKIAQLIIEAGKAGSNISIVDITSSFVDKDNKPLSADALAKLLAALKISTGAVPSSIGVNVTGGSASSPFEPRVIEIGLGEPDRLRVENDVLLIIAKTPDGKFIAYDESDPSKILWASDDGKKWKKSAASVVADVNQILSGKRSVYDLGVKDEHGKQTRFPLAREVTNAKDPADQKVLLEGVEQATQGSPNTPNR